MTKIVTGGKMAKTRVAVDSNQKSEMHYPIHSPQRRSEIYFVGNTDLFHIAFSQFESCLDSPLSWSTIHT